MINESVLRENDIRGIYGEGITEEFAYLVGLCFGTYLKSKKKNECIVGYDNRTSGELLVENLINGLLNVGINVKFIGMVTTPILNYATINLNIEAGVMVTASHNPANNNGFKVFSDNFLHLKRNELELFYDLLKNKKYILNPIGKKEYINIVPAYINMIESYITITKKLKVAFDTGNGTTSLFIKDIIKKFNIDAIFINDISDGTFPNHNPDPNKDENLTELKKIVKENNFDLGIAYDGDGDRVGIVDELGNTIESDKLLAIFARDIMPKTNNKKVIIDVKCSEALVNDIKRIDAEPIMVKNGSAFIENVMQDKDVLIGGEYSGHIFFRDKFYGFDDGIYASLRLIEILSNKGIKCSELLNGYEFYYNTPEIRVKTTDEKKWGIIEQVKKYVEEKNYEYLNIDGVRIKFNDGWALLRCSNTEPSITMRFEAKTEERLKSIQEEFTNILQKLL
ncbi:MAG: phosphomannomutase/phosphoglucomutase [Bacilli bacterium]|nr:phosphomannomutase/phosphoglucomutase [Bacilli bacterium]